MSLEYLNEKSKLDIFKAVSIESGNSLFDVYEAFGRRT